LEEKINMGNEPSKSDENIPSSPRSSNQQSPHFGSPHYEDSQQQHQHHHQQGQYTNHSSPRTNVHFANPHATTTTNNKGGASSPRHHNAFGPRFDPTSPPVSHSSYLNNASGGNGNTSNYYSNSPATSSAPSFLSTSGIVSVPTANGGSMQCVMVTQSDGSIVAVPLANSSFFDSRQQQQQQQQQHQYNAFEMDVEEISPDTPSTRSSKSQESASNSNSPALRGGNGALQQQQQQQYTQAFATSPPTSFGEMVNEEGDEGDTSEEENSSHSQNSAKQGSALNVKSLSGIASLHYSSSPSTAAAPLATSRKHSDASSNNNNNSSTPQAPLATSRKTEPTQEDSSSSSSSNNKTNKKSKPKLAKLTLAKKHSFRKVKDAAGAASALDAANNPRDSVRNFEELKGASIDNVQRRFSFRDQWFVGKCVAVENADTLIVAIPRSSMQTGFEKENSNSNSSNIAVSKFVAFRLRLENYHAPYSGHMHCYEILKSLVLGKIIYFRLEKTFIPDHLLAKLASAPTDPQTYDVYEDFRRTIAYESVSNVVENRYAQVYVYPTYLTQVRPRDASALNSKLNFERSTVLTLLETTNPDSFFAYQQKSSSSSGAHTVKCVSSEALVKVFDPDVNLPKTPEYQMSIKRKNNNSNSNSNNKSTMPEAGWQLCPVPSIDRSKIMSFASIDDSFEKMFMYSLVCVAAHDAVDYGVEERVMAVRRYLVGINTIYVPCTTNVDPALLKQWKGDFRVHLMHLNTWLMRRLLQVANGYMESSAKHEEDRENLARQ